MLAVHLPSYFLSPLRLGGLFWGRLLFSKSAWDLEIPIMRAFALALVLAAVPLDAPLAVTNY